MKPLLILRPEPGLSRSLERAKALGLSAVPCPLFVIERLTWRAPPADGFDALLLTSANAVREAGPGIDAYRELPVHAVGEATAAAARDAGLTIATTGPRGAEVLLEQIAGRQRLLHLAGAHRVATNYFRHDVTSVAVYCAAEIDGVRIPPLEGIVIAVHSPRAGRRLETLVTERGKATIAAISPAAAAACGDGWADVAVAPVPSDEALLALAAELCQVAGRS